MAVTENGDVHLLSVKITSSLLLYIIVFELSNVLPGFTAYKYMLKKSK